MPGSGLPKGYRLETLETVDSTNLEALRRSVQGEQGPLWIRAVEQSGGRGRNGRGWLSPPGNLYASLLIQLDVAPERASQLALVAGVAVHRVIASLLPQEAATRRLHLKWPNDLLLDAAKLAGVLVEASMTTGTRELTAVIGIGVNVATHPAGIGRPATHLALHGAGIAPADLLARIAGSVDLVLGLWLKQGFAALREEWLARAHRIGVEVAAETHAGPVRGIFTGLAEDGALMVKSEDGSEHRVSFGDVTII
jgi:BirA family biotin operon repressor/biotin-[acetyl-CoA-carboxylase] ligase